MTFVKSLLLVIQPSTVSKQKCFHNCVRTCSWISSTSSVNCQSKEELEMLPVSRGSAESAFIHVPLRLWFFIFYICRILHQKHTRILLFLYFLIYKHTHPPKVMVSCWLFEVRFVSISSTKTKGNNWAERHRRWRCSCRRIRQDISLITENRHTMFSNFC